MLSEPLVSCIMPTADRQQWAWQAAEMFLAQTWGNKELVVIDDGRVPVELPKDTRIRVHRVLWKNLLGAKRNLACSMAQGDIICHWDDDDAYAADRIEDQVTRLIESGKQVTGYHTMLFADLRDGSMHLWRYRDTSFAIGVSLMYRKCFWRSHPFDAACASGEDATIMMKARHCDQIVNADAERRLIATIHDHNTCPRDMKLNHWESATCV